MGKINSNSSKVKIEEQINQKNLTEFEKSVVDEYESLKNLTDGKVKPSLVDQFFILTNYKKKLSRLNKWINIAYQDLTEEERQTILERRKYLLNEDYKINEYDQLEKFNNLLDEINSNSPDSSVNIINNSNREEIIKNNFMAYQKNNQSVSNLRGVESSNNEKKEIIRM